MCVAIALAIYVANTDFSHPWDGDDRADDGGSRHPSDDNDGGDDEEHDRDASRR